MLSVIRPFTWALKVVCLGCLDYRKSCVVKVLLVTNHYFQHVLVKYERKILPHAKIFSAYAHLKHW